MDDWIDVNKNMPKPGSWVLAFSDNRIDILFFDGWNEYDDIFWLKDGDWEYYVSHWMSLPAPPHPNPAAKQIEQVKQTLKGRIV